MQETTNNKKKTTKELLARVRKIEIKTRRLSDNVFGGEYHSAFKGRGMTFSEVRPYQWGDDIRNIDWNVTARYNQTYVKVFEEERELTLMLVVDVSASQNFGTKEQFKNELITEIAATLAFSALQNNDKTGLVLFSDQVELYIPPKKGKSHILRIIRELIEFEPKSQKTSIASALDFINKVIKKRSIVFVMSDFMDQNYSKSLQILSKKHDVTGIRLYDTREENMPDVGLVIFQDNENQRIVSVDTSSKQTREAYRKNYQEKVNYFKNSFKKSGAGIIENNTEENYIKKLLMYFKHTK